MNANNKVINAVLYTGIVLILVASGFAIKGVEVTSVKPDSTNAYLEVGWVILCLVFVALLIFFDAIRRMLTIKIRNTAISTLMVLVCSVAFLAEFGFMIPNLTSGYKDSPTWVFIMQTIGLFFGTTLLSILLFKIGQSMA